MTGSVLLTIILSLISVFAVGVLYFLPYLIAKNRKHRNTTAIGLVNLFLGFTCIGWFAALIWALANGSPTVVNNYYNGEKQG